MESQKSIQEYLNASANPVLSQMLIDIIKERPKNVLLFCKAWCEKKIEFHKVMAYIDSDEEEQDIVQDKVIAAKRERPKAQERRNAVSGASCSISDLEKQFEPKVIKKRSAVKNRILFRLKSSFLFNELNDNDINMLINAMQEETVSPGTVVIQEGEIGETVYILEEGELECYKIDPYSKLKGVIKEIREGEIFGELSLLYNVPRYASVVAKKKCQIFKLDRRTFNFVIRRNSISKRQLYCSAIDQVDLFKELTREERSRLEGIIREMNIHSNQYVIRQGQIGNKFYIVQKGQLVAIKRNENGLDTIVYQYKESDYFGELSLISNKARAASVMALTNTKLLYIEREAFQRIIGSMEAVLQRNSSIYSKYMKGNGNSQ